VSPPPHPLPDSETCTERQDGGAKYVNFVQHFSGCRTHICYSCGRNSRSSQLASYSLFKGLGNARLQNSILCREKCQVLTKFSILLLPYMEKKDRTQWILTHVQYVSGLLVHWSSSIQGSAGTQHIICKDLHLIKTLVSEVCK